MFLQPPPPLLQLEPRAWGGMQGLYHGIFLLMRGKSPQRYDPCAAKIKVPLLLMVKEKVLFVLKFLILLQR
jgi:hypothetical protein